MSDPLRERCKEFLAGAQRDAIMRQGSPVDDLLAFVLSERGRTADPSLSDATPLVLYFANKEDREAFVNLVRDAKPGMRMKDLP